VLFRNSAAELRVLSGCVELLMTYQDPNSAPPQRPPEVDPLQPLQAGSPRYGDVDQSTWNTAVIVATVFAALVVIATIVWAVRSNQETATTSPPTTMGQAPQPPTK
jgi:hypothetical protein